MSCLGHDLLLAFRVVARQGVAARVGRLLHAGLVAYAFAEGRGGKRVAAEQVDERLIGAVRRPKD